MAEEHAVTMSPRPRHLSKQGDAARQWQQQRYAAWRRHAGLE
jgi:hypothetical protein